MGFVHYQNSEGKKLTKTGKFCLPTPIGGYSGKYSTVPNTFSISGIAPDLDNPLLAIATTAAAITFQSGEIVTITGSNEAEYNGVFTVTVLTPTTFSYWFEGSAGPSTGTEVGDLGGCIAVGEDTLAKTELKEGDWLYDPDQDACRQIKSIRNNTSWTFWENFPANVADAAILKAQSGVYNYIKVTNTGGVAGEYMEVAMAAAESDVLDDFNGLAPVCGDATGTTFKIVLQKRQK